MATRGQLLRYWHTKLNRLREHARAEGTYEAWHEELDAKVLGYLISRYDDPTGWSTFAAEPPSPAGGLADPGRPAQASLMIRPVPGAGVPPKNSATIRSFLDDIHQNNAASYDEFGLSRMYESN